MLPVKRLEGSLVMVHAHAAHALRELLAVGTTPSGPEPVLQHAPDTFQGMPRVSTTRWQKMPRPRLVPGRQRRRALLRPRDAAALDPQDARWPRAANDRPHLLAIVAQPRGLTHGARLSSSRSPSPMGQPPGRAAPHRGARGANAARAPRLGVCGPPRVCSASGSAGVGARETVGLDAPSRRGAGHSAPGPLPRPRAGASRHHGRGMRAPRGR